MLFNIVTALALAAAVRAIAIPDVATATQAVRAIAIPDVGMSPRELSPLEKRDEWYDCDGSSVCRTLSVAACDRAVNDNLTRNDDVNYGAPDSGRQWTGACSIVAPGFGCGVFIAGDKNCARTGNQMWYDYQDIRKSGCRVCGSKHWGNGCRTTINYVSTCNQW